MVSACRGWGTQRANPGGPAAQSLCLPVPRGPSTQWATTGALEAFYGATSARKGSSTQGANPGAPAAHCLCLSTLRGPCTQWATTGAPDVFCGATSARRGSGTQGANHGATAAQRRCSSAPRGSSTQWATAGGPEVPCGTECWARQGKEPPTKQGWAVPGQCVDEQGTWASRTRKCSEAGCRRPQDGGVWTAKTVKRLGNNQRNPNNPTTGRR